MIEREVKKSIFDINNTFKVLVVTGPRQVGKMNSLKYREIHNNITDYVFDPTNLKDGAYIPSEEIFKHIYEGGMPELYDIQDMNREKFFESYIDTYLEKDVRKIINVNNLKTFKKFIKCIALRSGKTLNYSDIANDVGTLNITYLRNKEKDEIDLIITKNATVYPIEIKKTANPKREMLKNFSILERNGVKVGNGGIICLYDSYYR